MFISKDEKEELNIKIKVLEEKVNLLQLAQTDAMIKVSKLEELFKLLIDINKEEIGDKIKELVKIAYTGFKDLFTEDDKKVVKTNKKSEIKQKHFTKSKK